MFEDNLKNFEKEYDDIFQREIDELKKIIKDCFYINQRDCDDIISPNDSYINIKNFWNIPSEVELDAIEIKLNKIISIHSNIPNDNRNRYTVTEEFLHKHS